jgi:hypothetical protein
MTFGRGSLGFAAAASATAVVASTAATVIPSAVSTSVIPSTIPTAIVPPTVAASIAAAVSVLGMSARNASVKGVKVEGNGLQAKGNAQGESGYERGNARTGLHP